MGLRLIFWIYNVSAFGTISLKAAFRIGCRGFQQDLATIILANSPVLLLVLIADWLPGARKLLYGAARILFVLLNTVLLALNLLDAGYYSFLRRRSNSDLLYVWKDSLPAVGSMVAAFWPLLICFFGCMILLGWMAWRVHSPLRDRPSVRRGFPLLFGQLLFILLLILPTGLLIPGQRVIPGTPLLSVEPKYLSLAQNSGLTFAYSLLEHQETFGTRAYFSPEVLKQLVRTDRPVEETGSADTMRRKNVVICILESFSRCYLVPGDPYKANTPFFDSLIRKSIFFPNSWAEGTESNQGIASILAGLPAFLDQPFYYSQYANTPLRGIGNVLKEERYSTNFFMGAGKDHFGFGKFTKMAGIDHYYSSDDFHDDRFFDGNWGIFDEPFLQFGAQKLSTIREPFLAVFFNISSHFPYTIPAPYKDRFAFPDKTIPQRSVSYVDYSFQRFFETCRKAPWFKNTLFVFSADHWLSPAPGKIHYTRVNSFTIPMFLYDPSCDSGEVRSTLANQVDLTPTILDRLHYKGNYYGFGRSLLDRTLPDSDRYTVNHFEVAYQIIDDKYVLGYDTAQNKTLYMYDYHTDSLLRDNLIGNKNLLPRQERLEKFLKANLQAYSEALSRRSFE